MAIPPDDSLVVNPPRLSLDGESCILTGTGRRYQVRGFPGQLSIKTVVCGRAAWSTAEGRHPVGEDGWLLLEHGQAYDLEIESREPTETFVLFFRRGLVDEAAAALALGDRALLGDPERTLPLRFAERVRRHDPRLTLLLRELRGAVRGGSPWHGFLADRLQLVAGWLAAGQLEVRRQRARLGALRASTRAELMRRLLRARDYLEDNLGRRVGLAELARAACLSQHHLHRQFSRAFGATPQRWQAERRLWEARRLLEETGLPVTSVCLQVGLESLGSFSARFHRRFGLTPSGARAAAREKQA